MKDHRFLDEALPGLGASLILDFDQVIASTLEFPDIGAPVEGVPAEFGVRRRILQRFGVEVDYLVAGDTLVILAVFHCRRRPGSWKERLKRL